MSNYSFSMNYPWYSGGFDESYDEFADGCEVLSPEPEMEALLGRLGMRLSDFFYGDEGAYIWSICGDVDLTYYAPEDVIMIPKTTKMTQKEIVNRLEKDFNCLIEAAEEECKEICDWGEDDE